MTEPLQIVERTLEELGATTPERVAELFAEVRAAFEGQVAGVRNPEDWKQFRDAWLGRKSGALAQLTEHWLKPAGSKLKPSVGRGLNELRGHVEPAIEARRVALDAQAAERAAAAERIDLTLPGIERALGTRHLVQQTLEEIQDIFLRLGFAIAEGPEVETAYYNFEALNIPEFHPAREMWDTFYVGGPAVTPGKLVLRTHTSPMQIRIMERQPPPVRVIVPGKVYRRDNPDASHLFMFHQIEGLAVDRDLTFADFKGTIEFFVREFLGPKEKTRLRPSYFPFT